MTGYAPVGHLTGTFSSRVNITDRNPWIYTIASMSARVICIRESNGDTGLLGELAAQLGNSSGSFMLAQTTSLGLALPGPPYVVVAARLPSGNDPAEFDVNRPGIFGGSNSDVDWSHDEQDDEQIQP